MQQEDRRSGSSWGARRTAALGWGKSPRRFQRRGDDQPAVIPARADELLTQLAERDGVEVLEQRLAAQVASGGRSRCWRTCRFQSLSAPATQYGDFVRPT